MTIPTTIDHQGFLAMRKADDPAKKPAVYHAVLSREQWALCEPSGTRSEWAEPPVDVITCLHCLATLASINRQIDGIEQMGRDYRAKQEEARRLLSGSSE